MKKAIAITMAALVAGVASADLAVDWSSGAAGAIIESGGVNPTGPYVEGGTIQLIWSTTAGITAPGVYDLGALNGVSEFVLLQDVTGAFGQGFAGSGIWNDADVGGNDIASGYFYTRVFSATTASFLDFAQENPVLTAYSATDPSTTYSDPVLSGVFEVDANGTTVIPEPATIGLMGIAGLGMFLARKKARR